MSNVAETLKQAIRDEAAARVEVARLKRNLALATAGATVGGEIVGKNEAERNSQALMMFAADGDALHAAESRLVYAVAEREAARIDYEVEARP